MPKFEPINHGGVWSLGDISLGTLFSTARQIKNGTWIWKTENISIGLFTRNRPCLRILSYRARMWRVIQYAEAKEDLYPYLYLLVRHYRNDKGFEKRRKLFDQVPDIIERFSPSGDVDNQVDFLMRQIYGVKK